MAGRLIRMKIYYHMIYKYSAVPIHLTELSQYCCVPLASTFITPFQLQWSSHKSTQNSLCPSRSSILSLKMLPAFFCTCFNDRSWRWCISSCQLIYVLIDIVISHLFISHFIMSHHVISYHIILYYIISYLISYHIISYHIISYHIISYDIISYHIK